MVLLEFREVETRYGVEIDKTESYSMDGREVRAVKYLIFVLFSSTN
jgi:hypothetical protein